MDSETIIFIVISHRGAVHIPRLFRSLQEQTVQNWKLVIVDNSGDEQELENIRSITSAESRAMVIAEQNLGYFSTAESIRGKIVGNKNTIVICNPDAALSGEGSLQVLKNCAEIPDVGIVAPRIISSRDGHNQNPNYESRPSKSAQLRRKLSMSTPALVEIVGRISKVKRKLFRNNQKKTDLQRDIYAAHGSFMVFTRQFFLAGGDLSHPLFLFGEELTAAERCRKLGLRTVYTPNATVSHIEHGGLGISRSREIRKHTAAAVDYGYKLLYGKLK